MNRYVVALDLTPKQVVELRIKAIQCGLTVKELVKRAIEEYLKIFKEE